VVCAGTLFVCCPAASLSSPFLCLSCWFIAQADRLCEGLQAVQRISAVTAGCLLQSRGALITAGCLLQSRGALISQCSGAPWHVQGINGLPACAGLTIYIP
jgi:hypothetical protein